VTAARPAAPPLVPARTALGSRGAVVSPHTLASAAGLGILRAGGSAVDAAIATNAALAVVASSACGLGGDAFWLIWDGSTEVGLNGSGRSGAAATIEAARAAGHRDHLPVRGAWTVTVPGAIRSWGDAHARFGRLPWAQLLAPAIELADGFPATPGWVAAVERSVTIFGTDTDWARVFRAVGRPWRVGERVVITGLAATLRTLAAEGPDAAYTGSLAARSAEYLAARGAPVSGEDLAAHRSTWTEPIRGSYRGTTVTSHPPNSCGPSALELLAILERFHPPPRRRFGANGPTDAGWIHLGLEAARTVMADRDRWLTDPDAMAAGALERILSAGHAADAAALLDPEHVLPRGAVLGPRGGGTVHLATADRWGGLVSLLQSNYAGFGSGLVDPSTGIGFQNRGAFFTLDPRDANALAPRKRTMHTLTPGLAFRDGRPWLVHGAMGGEIQPQLFAQFISAMVDGTADLATAIAAPRWAADVPAHHQPPNVTRLERRVPTAVARGLEARGHVVTWGLPFDSAFGHEHAIELYWPTEGTADRTLGPTFGAVTDPRSEGSPSVW
jgi:gamma-glutamyltranspeptidase